MRKFNTDVDPLGQEVLSFLERVKGVQQVPNLRLGEKERWRVIVHFDPCAKIRYVIAKIDDKLILVTAHPDPDAENFIEFK
ncbi:hypothetical protein [Acidianus sp. HS-5]|uniref:hypothetical protein n=1 Tax=Acidianus sp. HS-5 TaxID=2886040 RepID=UPI001F264B45|nr:hypothetical protein [Acidianus sp. HS-5]BDC18901.1 hypothetical protein HS5_17910 [Acidianus sp. HS-5]